MSVKHKFTGQELDDETGLYYYGARYYDPQLGRFISADTIVQAPFDPQTLNRYSYCRNNPIVYSDPSGQMFVVDDMLIAMAIGAAIGALTSGIQNDWDLQAMAMGALTGAISGAAFYGAGWAIGELNNAAFSAAFGAEAAYGVPVTVSTATQAVVHAGAGALSGGINTAINHGDIGMGALTGGISGGIAKGLGNFIPFEITDNTYANYAIGVASHATIGGITGGITATIYGGDFGQGFEQGAMTGAYGYMFNREMRRLVAGIWRYVRKDGTTMDEPRKDTMTKEEKADRALKVKLIDFAFNNSLQEAKDMIPPSEKASLYAFPAFRWMGPAEYAYDASRELWNKALKPALSSK